MKIQQFLTDREYEIYKMREKWMTYAEIWDSYWLSRQRIQQIYRVSEKKLERIKLLK